MSAKSFGFRGEVLSSLCETSAGFTVVTKTKDSDIGLRRLCKDGTIDSCEPMASLSAPPSSLKIFLPHSL